jgi:integrase
MSIKVRKTKNGTKYDLYFSAGKHPDGRRKFIWVRGFSTKTEAKAREIEIKNDMNNNKYVSPSKYSLKEWLDTVLERKEQKIRKSTFLTYKRFNDLVCSYMGEAKLQDINLTSIKQLQTFLLTKAGKNKSGIAHRTIRHIETWMKNVMQHAEDEQLISKNYYSMKSYEFVTVKIVEKEVWSPSDQQKLMKSAENYALELNDQRWYLFTLLGLTCGLRLGEIAGLKVEDVDLDQGIIHVLRSISWVSGEKNAFQVDPKSDAGHREIELDLEQMKFLRGYKVWLSDWLLDFKRELKGSDYLIPWHYDLGPLHKRTAQWRFEQIEKRAGVKHLGVHAMRHTSATNLHHVQIPVKLMQNRLGHSTPSVTLNTYTHLFKEKAKSKKISIANEHLFNYKNENV